MTSRCFLGLCEAKAEVNRKITEPRLQRSWGQGSTASAGAVESEVWAPLAYDVVYWGPPYSGKLPFIMDPRFWGVPDYAMANTQTQATVPDHDLHLTQRPQVRHLSGKVLGMPSVAEPYALNPDYHQAELQ